MLALNNLKPRLLLRDQLRQKKNANIQDNIAEVQYNYFNFLSPKITREFL